MNSIFSQFTNLYPISKTLRFSLEPQGETLENIKKWGVLEEDKAKADNYKIVKVIFDKCHKAYINSVLDSINLDWTVLAEAFFKYQKDKNEKTKKDFEEIKKVMMITLSKSLKKNENFKELEPKQLVSHAKNKLSGKPYCDTLIGRLSDEELQAVAGFDRFTTYFKGYQETRNNIYANDGSASITYRLIEENFPKFLNNILLFKKLSDCFKKELELKLSPFLNGKTLSEIFEVNYFNNVLNQKGIDNYNRIFEGNTEEGNVKLQGLNELCNIAYQQGTSKNKVKFNILYKQILSQRESASFLLDKFETDAQLLSAIKTYTDFLFSESIQQHFNEFKQILSSGNFDKMAVFVDDKRIAALSSLAFGEWDALRVLMQQNKIKKASAYNFELLQSVTTENLSAKFLEAVELAASEIAVAKEKVLPELCCEKIKTYDNIKAYLDSIVKLEGLMKIFSVSDAYEKDSAFYGDFDVFYGALRDNIPLYNQVRNYATKKPYSTEKSKLNFSNPTLADGWDQNKEYANNAIILIKKNNYYLGILNAKNKEKLFEKESPIINGYKKMVYKLLPGPNKMLPKVFFSKKGLETYGVDEYILEGYNAGKHKKGDAFDIKFCHDLINFFKEKISIHPDWKNFGFVFTNTEKYNDISEFYKEISQQSYKITYSYVSDEDISALVEKGSLFLFKIYNKDFSEKSTGKANTHTLYWKQIFSEENMRNIVFKLNGEAELFYRPASIENPFIHKKGEIIFGKIDKDKNVISDDLYESISADIQSGKDISYLTSTYKNISFREAPHDIIKDKRYSKNTFLFHVPITINYGVDDNSYRMNTRVLDIIKDNPDVSIIGIDRGERNLIYVSLIDRNGRIKEQKSFNIINGVDYLQKLKIMAKERDDARKNWKEIGKIKDTKEGYLSLVVHEIVKMMLENNAILVMEDLNIGFKRGRFHIEQQVYQKFEKMLIDKLNYLADKTKAADSLGGISRAYQLTNKFESFQKLGKQSGFLFYVPARWTSKIDPKTGFVNLFTSEQFSSPKVMLEKFKRISYNKTDDSFEFEFNYSDFNLNLQDYTNHWIVSTYGDQRIVYSKKEGRQKINVTANIKQLLADYGINFDSLDLHSQILKVSDSSFAKKFIWLFKVTVALRHEDETCDYILSPVKWKDGTFFDSRKVTGNEPVDGDANGAYHIALQGLRLLNNRIKNGKIENDGQNMQTYNWLEFVQKKDYLK